MDLATSLVAVGLAMDSFSVSIANGMPRRKFQISNALKIAFFFGGFQGVMLLIGWSMGVYVMDFIAVLIIG